MMAVLGDDALSILVSLGPSSSLGGGGREVRDF